MKVCRDCGKELIPGDTIGENRYIRRDYRCTECYSKLKTQAHRDDRAELIKLYGGCCAYCGETRQDLLQLDHIYGDAREDRAKLTGKVQKKNMSRTIWKNALATYQPEKYQILCDRCNAAKKDESEEEFFAWIARVYERNQNVSRIRHRNGRARAKRESAA